MYQTLHMMSRCIFINRAGVFGGTVPGNGARG